MILNHFTKKHVKELVDFVKAHGGDEMDVEKAIVALVQHYKVRRNDPLREKHRAAGWPFGPEACDR